MRCWRRSSASAAAPIWRRVTTAAAGSRTRAGGSNACPMPRPTLKLGHGSYISDNPNLHYSAHRDLELMGGAGVSVSHCPINIVRRARTLDDWQRYQQAGVNLCLGSDTYPRDMIMNMRTASYLGKIMSHTYFAATSADVLRAATLGGAISVARAAMWRRERGALADRVV